MDNLSNSDRDVDARNGFGLHHGWIHSHLARIGGSSCGDTVAQWPSSRLKHRSQSKGAVIFRAPFGTATVLLRSTALLCAAI